jgi:tetratricopeptide (TPR) repeat protein
MTSVGLALIAKNEENTLPTLLKSIEGAFDRVVLVDTGSTDATKQLFVAWAQQQSCTFSVGDFEWCDDFAAARVAADRLLLFGSTEKTDGTPLVDWTCWADCDDSIEGALNLRRLAESAPPELGAFIADYSYAFDEFGNVICTLRRERLVRAGAGSWTGRVHEAQLINGQSTLIDPQIVRWVHHKPPDFNPGDRNLKILHAWNDESPGDPRVLAYLGTETAARGLHQEALGFYRQYLDLKSGWDEERAQVHRKLAVTLFALNQPKEALEVGLQALAVLPSWTDSYLTLAQASHNLGEHAKAIEWANEVLRRGMPQSLLILNPLDYTFAPLQCLAAAHGSMGNVDEACKFAEQALAIIPTDPGLQHYRSRWATARKREQTAQTFAMCARLLVEHDEQLKALTLIENAVPHYVMDHAEIVALRSAIRERVRPLLDPAGIAEHYSTGDEQGYTDIDEVGKLPRAQFLLAGLIEQSEEAA